jgi:transposase-like protein
VKRRRHTPEQIIRKLREAERLLGEGKTIPEAAKELGISEQTYHRWRNQYGGMKAQDAKRLKELERENVSLKAIVADQALENRALKEIAKGTGRPSPSAPGGRDAARPSRRQRALGMPGGRAASLHAASRVRARGGRLGVAR